MDSSLLTSQSPSTDSGTIVLDPPAATAPVATITEPAPVATESVAAAPEASTEVQAVPEPSPTPAPALYDGVSAAFEGAQAGASLVGATDLPVNTPEPSGDMTTNKVRIIVKALRGIEQNISNIIRLLEEQGPSDAAVALAVDAERGTKELAMAAMRPVDGTVIEGVFDGRQMIGSDGKSYVVPPNYASKSKLVEGDMLKLTITPKGSFIYKQIGPIERARVVASLGFDQTTGEFYAAEGEKRWNVLKASITFFKGEPGDEVVLLLPKSAPSKWAAVENIIKQNPLV